MNRSQAFRVLVDACVACGIDTTRISTHSLRKTFVRRVYAASGNDLIRTQRAVGHSSPITTARYLETDAADLDRLVLTLAA
jgi:integrase